MTRPTNYLTEEEIHALKTVSAASLTTALFNRESGPPISGASVRCGPISGSSAMPTPCAISRCGEDLGGDTTFDNTTNPQRVTVEDVGPGDVLVIDARGEVGAGVLGDILITRMQQRGAAGIVTDGAFRDTPAIREIDLPTYSRSSAPYMSSIIHHPVETNTPIGCGGAAIIPGDVIVGDGEGVVVLPRAMAGEIAREAYEKEQYEDWALSVSSQARRSSTSTRPVTKHTLNISARSQVSHCPTTQSE
ncbi:MAG: hypothetical protein R2849_00385 [Thermomicrobiales bacterium]